MSIQMFVFILTVAMILSVIYLIRQQKMSFKYALAWLFLGFLVAFFTIKNEWLYSIARWTGFELPSNFIFFLLLIFVIFFSLLLTIYINEQNSRTESLAQAVAKLDYRIKQLEKPAESDKH